MRRRALLVGGFSAILVLALLLVGPAFLDAGRFKPAIEAGLSALLHRTVSVEGPIALSLLPVPAVTLTDVHVAANGPEGKALGHIGAVRLRPSLAALLSGRLAIGSLRLDRPEFSIGSEEDALSLLAFKPESAVEAGGTLETGSDMPALAARGGKTPEDRLGTVVIRDGTLELGGKDGTRRIAIEQAVFTSGGPAGPFRLVAEGRGGDLSLDFDLAVGEMTEDRTAPVSFEIETPSGDARSSFSGSWKGGGATGLSGRLSLQIAHWERLRPLPAWAGVIGAAGPLKLDARIDGGRRGLAISEIVARLGGGIWTGGANLYFAGRPRIEATLSTDKLDLDRALVKSEATIPQNAAGQTVSTAAAGPGPGGGPAPILVMPDLPAFLDADLDLTVEALTWHGGMLHQAHLDLALANGEVTLNQASANLPGGGVANLFGYFSAGAFDGSFDLADDDLRPLLSWLGIGTGGVPDDRLRSLKLAGSLKLAADQLSLDGVDATLDGAPFRAAAVFRMGAAPALAASIAGQRFDLDAYRPSVTPSSSPGAPAPDIRPPSGEAPMPARSLLLLPVPVNLRVRLAQLLVGGTLLGDVALDGGLAGGRAELTNLSIGDLAGAAVKINGGVERDAAGWRLDALHFDISHADPERLLALPGFKSPSYAQRLAPLAMAGVLDGDASRLSVDLHAEGGGAQMGVSGALLDVLKAPALQIGVEISHSSLAQFLQLFAPSYHPGGTLGAFAASFRAEGPLSSQKLSDLRIKFGPVLLAGEGAVDLAGRPRIEAKITAGEIPIDPFLSAEKRADAPGSLPDMVASGLLVPTLARRADALSPPLVKVSALDDRWSRAPLDWSWLKAVDAGVTLDARALLFDRQRIENAAIGLSVANGTASLEGLTGQLYGGHLTANGTLTADGKAALHVELSHAVAHDALLKLADLGLAEGTLDGEASLASYGQSAAELIGRLAGTAKLSVTDGLLKGFDLKAADQSLKAGGAAGLIGLFKAGLTGGGTRFSDLSGDCKIADGLAACDDLSLSAEGGKGRGRADINLVAYQIDAMLSFHLDDGAAAPPLVVKLAGPLDRPTETFDVNAIEGWLKQQMPAQGAGGKAKIKPKDILNSLLPGLLH